MTDAPRTAAGREMLDGLERFVSGRPVSERQAQWTRMILAIEEEAAASPPATETGGLDRELFAEALHRLGFLYSPALDGHDPFTDCYCADARREDAAYILDEVARLRSPSVGEDAQT